MEVAVGIDGLPLHTLRQSEGCLGRILGVEPVDLSVPLGFQNDPLDVVLLRHGMDHVAHHDLDGVALHRDSGDVLLRCCVSDAGLQLGHGLAAANQGHLGRGQLGGNVAAVVKEISNMLDGTSLAGLKLTIDLKRGTDPDKLMESSSA